MRKLTIKEMGKAKLNPIFKGLPKELKDKSRYVAIEKQVRDVMYSDHQPHKSMKGFVACKRCAAKLARRQQLLKDLGFTSYPQYMEWKKIMSIIISERDITLS